MDIRNNPIAFRQTNLKLYFKRFASMNNHMQAYYEIIKI